MSSDGASSATYDLLLEAGTRVMQRDGAGNLTLDAVAREAGVSKGGLLYHFPNKQALLRGMVAGGMRHHENEVAQAIGPEDGRGSFARGFLRHALLSPEGLNCKPPAEVVWSMLGAAATDPTLIEPARTMQAHWQKRLEEDLDDPTIAALFRLVSHGLWSAELFGFDVPDRGQRERILELLCSVAGLNEMEEK